MVTSRLLDLPIFAAIMVRVYHISISIVGDWLTNWMNGVSPQGQTGGDVRDARAPARTAAMQRQPGTRLKTNPDTPNLRACCTLETKRPFPA